MSTIAEARNAVDSVGEIAGEEDYINAFVVVLDASKGASGDGLIDLQTIAEDLLGKLPDVESMNRLARIVEKLVEDLSFMIVSDRLERIEKRNKELKRLVDDLGIEVKTAKSDAALLPKITEHINKAKEAAEAIKTLVTELNDPDANAAAKIKSILTALDDLAEIFPEP